MTGHQLAAWDDVLGRVLHFCFSLFSTRNEEYDYGFEWIVASRLIYVIGLYHAVQKSGTVVVS